MDINSPNKKIRLLLAEDHKVMREGLASLITNEFHMEVVGQAEDGNEAIEQAFSLQPDIVLMDITLPKLNGIEATRAILEKMPEIRIIALSMHADKRFVMEMMNAGAAGYLLKHSAADELERAIKAVMIGHNYITPAVTGIMVKEYRDAKFQHQPTEEPLLSVREKEVLRFLAEGKTTKEISIIINISSKTIESHRNNIMSKLQLFSIAELTKYAIREGLTSIDR